MKNDEKEEKQIKAIDEISITYTEARALYNSTHTRQDVFDIPTNQGNR
jgi:hypothetical protein